MDLQVHNDFNDSNGDPLAKTGRGTNITAQKAQARAFQLVFYSTLASFCPHPPTPHTRPRPRSRSRTVDGGWGGWKGGSWMPGWKEKLNAGWARNILEWIERDL